MGSETNHDQDSGTCQRTQKLGFKYPNSYLACKAEYAVTSSYYVQQKEREKDYRNQPSTAISHQFLFPSQKGNELDFLARAKTDTSWKSRNAARSNDDDERSAIYPCKRRAQARNRPSEHLELGNRERKTWRGSPSPPPSSSLHSPRTCEHASFAPLSQIVPYPPSSRTTFLSFQGSNSSQIEAQAAADSVLGPTARFRRARLDSLEV